ncbi:unnamed protein product [Meganyctiphanes norvegica]|uniref:lysoplasmalogenase n=1 Tax=Meganyctiphanes norvegica TaxID=48144 RepID=A0AAV2PMJ8_MEGNR
MENKNRHLSEFYPFVGLVLISFVFHVPYEIPSVTIAIIKCLPILWLLLILLHVRLLHSKQETPEKLQERRILIISLIFSLIGDFTLVWKDYFIPGALSFAMAQVLMVCAFGFRHINWTIGMVLYTLAALGLSVILRGAPNMAMQAVVLFYTLLLVTMLWRSIDRALALQVTAETPRWYVWAPVVGSVLFVISDSAIGIFLFVVTVPHIVSQSIIIATYYTAQAFIVCGSL